MKVQLYYLLWKLRRKLINIFYFMILYHLWEFHVCFLGSVWCDLSYRLLVTKQQKLLTIMRYWHLFLKHSVKRWIKCVHLIINLLAVSRLLKNILLCLHCKQGQLSAEKPAFWPLILFFFLNKINLGLKISMELYIVFKPCLLQF